MFSFFLKVLCQYHLIGHHGKGNGRDRTSAVLRMVLAPTLSTVGIMIEGCREMVVSSEGQGKEERWRKSCGR